MKKKLSEISEYFKVEKLKNDKQVVVFLVCLLIATILWFLNALSKDYDTTISYPVKYTNPPENQFVSNELPDKLDLKVEAHGFTLLRHKLSLSFSPLVLNLTNITRNLTSESGSYTIRTSTLMNTVSNQISNEISVTGILPEYFTLILDSLTTKTVPVELNIHLNFNPQFNLKEPVSVTPDTIRITGPAIILDTIRSLKTEERTFERLNADIERVLTIEHPRRTEIEPEKVTLEIPVEKFTEKEIRVPIQIINKPVDVNMKLFPSEIRLSILVGLSEFENVTATNFNAVVDYNSIVNSAENLEVNIDKKPSFVEVLRISPETVEYLIETE